jgi:hypothetical protein
MSQRRLRTEVFGRRYVDWDEHETHMQPAASKIDSPLQLTRADVGASHRDRGASARGQGGGRALPRAPGHHPPRLSHRSPKTRQNRRKLLAPLADDLAEWKLVTGQRGGLVVPREDGEPWTKHHLPALAPARLQPNAAALTYDLRGSYVSLLAWEGYTLLEVARQTGPQRRGLRFAATFDVDPATRVTAEAAIRAAREPDGAKCCALFDAKGEARWRESLPRDLSPPSDSNRKPLHYK